jgi:hypothetical protein
VAIENKTKAPLDDKLIKWLLMEMDQFLEEVKIEFNRWHFEQIRKYTIALGATYESIW